MARRSYHDCNRVSYLDRSLSILFVTAMYPHQEQPGSGAFVMHQVRHLRALGNQVKVLHIRGYESRWNYLLGAFKVLGETWRSRYDIVHVHYGLTGVCALIRWRTPMVVTLHGSDVLQGRLQRFVSRMVSSIADATIVVSPDIASRCPGTVIPCGVDLEKFSRTERAQAREELGLSAAGKLVLFPFNPDRRLKRFDIAEAAVQLLRRRGMDVSILPVWNVVNERMPLYYSAADVMVLCSDTEGSPTSVKEALACDLPVVATDVGDVRSILTGIDGTEICEQNVESLTAGLERALKRHEQFAFHSHLAMKRFDQSRTGRALMDVYTTVCAKTPVL
jgi:teichuronic acid biosynthesis glycosyltransferase TuaC